MSRARPPELYARLDSLLAEGREVAVATVVRSSGSVPRRVGAKMIVAGRGETWDTIGGGSFEALVVEDALDVIATGAPVLKRYTFSEQGEDSVGQVCGGTVEVFLEPVGAPDKLLILGGGHVGQALARHAVGLGFQVTVADDRAEYVSSDLFPPSVRLVHTDASFRKGLPGLDRRTYVTILTRCHRTDREALGRVLSGESCRYVGLIGSRRKRLALYRDLESSGVSPSLLESVHSPIGLEIGAETPAEIAISILAELVRERRQAATARSKNGEPGGQVREFGSTKA